MKRIGSANSDMMAALFPFFLTFLSFFLKSRRFGRLSFCISGRLTKRIGLPYNGRLYA